MRAYYNENDPCAAYVLRALIAAGLIAPGDVDDRSIKEVQPDDLRGYTQCHFFAGHGGWSVAARLAGWPDDRPLWTASCPCQPFSAAGKGRGTDDPRHLWPDLFRLVSACRPAVLVGEQVSGAPGYGWLDGIRADLATEGYASEAVDIPACAVDAPHQRNRLYWIALADSTGAGRDAAAFSGVHREAQGPRSRHGESERLSGFDGALGDAFGAGLERQSGHGDAGGRSLPHGPVAAPDDRNGPGVHADAYALRGLQPQGGVRLQRRRAGNSDDRRNGSFWSGAEWIACHDGKARRAKPGICDVAHGHVGRIDSGDDPGGSVAPKIPQGLLVKNMPGRIDLWRLAGNGLVLPLAAEVLASLREVIDANG